MVSTNPSQYSPCHGDSRLLAISYSYSRITDYNPYLILSYFVRLAKIRIFASLCLGICGTSIAHNIKAMMICLSPLYHIQYGEQNRFIKINFTNKAGVYVNSMAFATVSQH